MKYKVSLRHAILWFCFTLFYVAPSLSTHQNFGLDAQRTAATRPSKPWVDEAQKDAFIRENIKRIRSYSAQGNHVDDFSLSLFDKIYIAVTLPILPRVLYEIYSFLW